ncbi:triacylglycerol lipase 2-like protein [Corchorus olitorius]|uniref:Triacylglycerol lipase 2-like protein n=1 Tax=Corchorus olitorius TaxID=93759 RepID=A0A1R3L4Q2_9ROSI|nr:triacylglycerol lipase 2-like protein [Corchorus olitorius]
MVSGSEMVVPAYFVLLTAIDRLPCHHVKVRPLLDPDLLLTWQWWVLKASWSSIRGYQLPGKVFYLLFDFLAGLLCFPRNCLGDVA